MNSTPVVLWDVDGVLNPHRPSADHVGHRFDDLDPTGTPATGTVYLHPAHAGWIAELTAAGADHAWATSWGPLAASWLAPRLGHAPAADWPVIDVGVQGGVTWGRTNKFNPVVEFLGPDRPVFWLDDCFGGKDPGWAEDRTARGVPTVVREISAPAGLARADVDAALDWLAAVRAERA